MCYYLFARREPLFVFEFEDALFAFATATPPFAFALLFERPTTRLVRDPLPFGFYFLLCDGGRAVKSDRHAQRTIAHRLLFFILLTYFYLTTEGKTRTETRIRERRRIKRIRNGDTATRIRIAARTTDNTAS